MHIHSSTGAVRLLMASLMVTVGLMLSGCPMWFYPAIPNVAGQPQPSAVAAITGVGFAVGEVKTECSNNVPAGVVISQDPPAKTKARPGTAVNMVVSAGPCQVQVPNVEGKPQSTAESEIQAAGLTAGNVTQRCSDTVPAGSVISQDPAAGTQVNPGTAVNLVVSSGPCQGTVTVPGVVGQPLSQATETIQGLGLVVGQVTEQCSDTVPAGSVISQDPGAGTQVNPGSAVNLVVSSGPCAPLQGVVRDPQGNPVSGVTVTLTGGTVTKSSGGQSTVTGEDGSYSFPHRTVGEDLLKVESEDYTTNSIRLGDPVPGSTTIVNVTVLERSEPVTLDVSQGGEVEVGGVTLVLAPDSLVTEDGSPFSGQAEIRVTPLNVMDPEQFRAFPGSFRALTSNKEGQTGEAPLESLGLAEFDLRDAVTGTPLQLAPNSQAVIRFTLPAGTVPSEAEDYSLWYFDEALGYWIEEGDGTVSEDPESGLLEFSGTVSHFSWWNADKLMLTTCVTAQLVWNGGQPVSGVLVESTGVDYLGGWSETTDGQGQFCLNGRIDSVMRVYGDVPYNGGVLSWERIWNLPSDQARCDLGGCVYMGVIVLEAGVTPGVTGQSQVAAEAALQAAGYAVGTVTQQCSDSVAAGVVISQSPAAGTPFALGSTVNLVVSSGSCQGMVMVPDVTAQSVALATALLQAAGYVVGTVTQQCSGGNVPAGAVISQDPPAGVLLAPGSTVNLVVSNGQICAVVPDVTGQTVQAAYQTLQAEGLTVSVLEQCSDTVAAGSVISLDPPAGSLVNPGSAVNLVVSSGPCQGTVTVPDVTGQTVAGALATLQRSGLGVNVIYKCSDTVPEGSVISQTPAAGTLVAPGATVAISVSSGPCNVAVPNVVGLAPSQAETTIEQAGLVIGQVTQQCSNTVPVGTVIGQDPVAGTVVPVGTPVNLITASGSCN